MKSKQKETWAIIESVGAEKIKQRFWAKVQISDGCWEWIAWRYPQGYGSFGLAGKTIRAHRLAYVLTYGDIEGDLEVLHKCNNPPCCCPDHLYLGTPKDNMRDRSLAGSLHGHRNGSIIHPESRPRGERVNTAKLITSQVREIRQRYIPGKITSYELAKEYGVSTQVILAIIRGRIWKHVGGPIVVGELPREIVLQMKRKAALISVERRRERKLYALMGGAS